MSNIILRDRAIVIARRYVGVRETSRNSGPDIDRWLRLVRCKPGDPWCMAFVFGMYAEAADDSGVPNPMPRTGGVWKAWDAADELWKSDRPSVGAVFVHISTDQHGHCGIVVGLDSDGLITIEGNTNAAGSREGDGVYLKRRSLEYTDGFIDIGREGPAEAPRLV